MLTRRWVWRQAVHTLTEKVAEAVIYNVDTLVAMTNDELEQVSDEIRELVHHYCGGTSDFHLLNANQPKLSLKAG